MTGLLFDIDGTLIDTKGQGGAAFIQGIRETFSVRDDLSYIQFAGATDLGVLDQMARRHDIQLDDASIEDFFSSYAQHLEDRLDPDRVEALPHAHEVLETLRTDPGFELGLVTGNARRTAFIKLASVGLDGFFDEGGFGDESGVRSEIVQLARSRFQDCRRFAVIGDTPLDVFAALDSNSTPIAVITGQYSKKALVQAGAWRVISNLGNIFSALEDI